MAVCIRYVEWACLTSRDVFDDRVVYDEGAKIMHEGKEFRSVCFLSLAFRSIPLICVSFSLYGSFGNDLFSIWFVHLPFFY